MPFTIQSLKVLKELFFSINVTISQGVGSEKFQKNVMHYLNCPYDISKVNLKLLPPTELIKTKVISAGWGSQGMGILFKKSHKLV